MGERITFRRNEGLITVKPHWRGNPVVRGRFVNRRHKAKHGIGNIMKWRPELPTLYGNRPPTPEEMSYCLPYLAAQLEIVRPRVIVALGLTAVNGLLGFDPDRRIGAMRGRQLEFRGIAVVATYHPSYLLRNASVRSKRAAWEDFLAMMEIAGLPVSERQRGYFLPRR